MRSPERRPASSVPRAFTFQAPSASVKSLNDRALRIRACAASRSVARAFKHRSRTSASGLSSAPSSSPASASGATSAAAAIASAFAADNFPARNAFAVASRVRSFFDVSNWFFAAETDVPVIKASWSAAERYPPRFHLPASSTRRASNNFVAAARRSTVSNAVHKSVTSLNGTASGSIRATNTAKNSSISRTSSANERRVEVALTMQRTIQRG